MLYTDPRGTEECARLAEAFNPVYFDADEWIRLARDAGMKYFVFTSKHHDGFALFRSRADAFNVVDATPFKRDVVEELANACAIYPRGFDKVVNCQKGHFAVIRSRTV